MDRQHAMDSWLIASHESFKVEMYRPPYNHCDLIEQLLLIAIRKFSILTVRFHVSQITSPACSHFSKTGSNKNLSKSIYETGARRNAQFDTREHKHPRTLSTLEL